MDRIYKALPVEMLPGHLAESRRAGKLWITCPYSAMLTLREDSQWRDRAGFNGHPDLIPP